LVDVHGLDGAEREYQGRCLSVLGILSYYCWFRINAAAKDGRKQTK
ncbi:hypothetical protein Tco_0634265, partial [Tanacetum coccineum]